MKQLFSLYLVVSLLIIFFSFSSAHLPIKLLTQEISKFEVNPNYIPYDKVLRDSLYKLMNQKDYPEVIATIEKTAKDTILSKYNLGYVLFAVNGDKQVIEGDPQIRPDSDYDINWDEIKILEINDNNYTLLIGGIHFSTPQIKNGIIDDNKFTAPRNVGNKYLYLSVFGFNISIETIINSSDGIICLVGLSTS